MAALPDVIDALYIESLSYGGNGVGHHEGQVVFVPLTVPGDRVRCRIVRRKKRFAEGRVECLLDPSESRTAPVCSVFGECGGCQWQHMPYAVQCTWKERIFRDFLVRGLGIEPALVQPIEPSPSPWGYRSRVQFKCHNTPQGFLVGFFRRGSHYVIPVRDCPVIHPLLERARRDFQAWLAGSRWAGSTPQIDLAVDDRECMRAVVHCLASDTDALAEYLRPRAEAANVAVFIQSGRKNTMQHVCGTSELIVEIDQPVLRLGYGPGGFAQINLPQNRALVREVIDMLSPHPPDRVLDLFCGMGNFSLPVARLAREVSGVEAFPQSIEMAGFNARLNKVHNAAFFARDALGAATDFSRETSLDLVILDPPRSGAYEVARELATVRPARILYISCDPPTLVRDLQPLLHNGYRVVRCRPFDLFPQTHHIESVTLLERI